MTVEFTLTDEQKMIRDMTRAFVEKEVNPYVRDWEREGDHPDEIYVKMAAQGLMGAPFPSEYGGGGLDAVTYAILTEELAKGCSSLRTSISVHGSLAGSTIKYHANQEQKDRWLPDMSTGKKLGAWALTEPGSGSDAAGMQTTARRDGDDYLINGQKAWISNGGIADYIIVYAKTNPELRHKGISCFMVEKGTPGFEVVAIESKNKLGLRSSPTATLAFNDCRIPKENLIGSEGDGWKNAMFVLNHGRLSVAAGGVGIAQAAMDAAVKYAVDREAFGRPIGHFQLVQAMLAEMDVNIQAGRLLVWQAARMREAYDRDECTRDEWTQAVSRAKLFVAEMSLKVCEDSIQVHGANGYTDEFPVERYWRDAKVLGIYEGTNQIQRLILGRLITGLKVSPHREPGGRQANDSAKLDEVIAELVHRLQAVATPERATHEKDYLKSDLEHLGATVPDARAAAKWLQSTYPGIRANPWPLVEACWAANLYELRSTMSFFLERATLGEQALERIEALCRRCHTWALIDQIAVQVVPRAKPPQAWLARLATDDDFWVRRTALLAPLKELRAGKGSPAAWTQLALPNLDHSEEYIRKAIGWMLREIGKKRPEWTEAFVEAHRNEMSALSIREATRNLDSDD